MLEIIIILKTKKKETHKKIHLSSSCDINRYPVFFTRKKGKYNSNLQAKLSGRDDSEFTLPKKKLTIFPHNAIMTVGVVGIQCNIRVDNLEISIYELHELRIKLSQICGHRFEAAHSQCQGICP